jgi:hypothetical protein
MPSVNLSPIFNGVTNFDQYGNILAGGQIYTYQAGSSTPLQTYVDSNGTTPNTNPVILGADGKIPQELWLQANYNYKLILQTALGVVVDTYDNIGGILSQVPPNPASIPSGCILLWSGSVGSIPAGFVLCDGTNPGVPDLRNSFVLGAGNSYAVGQTGGSTDAIIVSHTHTATSLVTDPTHAHNYAAPVAEANGQGGGGTSGQTLMQNPPPSTNTSFVATGITVSTTNQSTGQSGSNANMPPYYALAYIYKL